MEDIFRELLFLGKCHHSFLDKPYQELDFTRHLNSALGKNTVRSADVSRDFISFYLLLLTFVLKLKSAD